MWTARPDAQVLRMDRVPGWAVCPSTGWGRTQGLGILYIIVRARARAGLRLRHEARAHCSTTSPLALTDRSMPSEGSHTVTIRCPATRSASACSGRFAPGRLHDSGVAGGASSATTSGGGGAYTVGSCRCVSFSRSSAFRSLRAFFSFFSVFSFFSLFSFLALRFSCLRSFLRSRFRRSRPELLLLLLLLVSSSSRLLRFWCFCLWRSASGRVSLLTALVVSPQQSRFLWSTIAIDARRLATETWRAVLARVTVSEIYLASIRCRPHGLKSATRICCRGLRTRCGEHPQHIYLPPAFNTPRQRAQPAFAPRDLR